MLRKSGYGYQISGVYSEILSYADNITISCPSIGGVNKMLKIYNTFAIENEIIFNKKNTVCIQFGEKQGSRTSCTQWILLTVGRQSKTPK